MKVDDFVQHLKRRLPGLIDEWDACDYIKAIQIIKLQREALDRLARLGNEPLYGNSLGNKIAKEALDMEV